MDLSAIRKDVAAVATTAGFNSWPYQPDDPQQLPACVIGGIRSMTRLNRLTTQFQIEVTFFANVADPEDAAKTLDRALSTGDPDSFLDGLDAQQNSPSASWRSVRFVSAGPYQRYSMPGGSAALGVVTVLEFTA